MRMKEIFSSIAPFFAFETYCRRRKRKLRITFLHECARYLECLKLVACRFRPEKHNCEMESEGERGLWSNFILTRGFVHSPRSYALTDFQTQYYKEGFRERGAERGVREGAATAAEQGCHVPA
jgi:hypothetical protein